MAHIFDRLISHRHGPFLAASAVALAVLPVALFYAREIALPIVTVVLFASYLAMMHFRIPMLTAAYLKKEVENADEPAPVILLVTAFAVLVSVISLFRALNGTQGVGLLRWLLAFAPVVFGWFTIHTMTAMHYAHLYWRPGPSGGPADRRQRGGLDFPGTTEPCGHDFLYFAFVIGMTAQTSDTAVTTTAMRRLNLVHAVTSFFFNTVLVAAAVNAAVALAN